jgi:hypothetical protein
VAQPAEQLIHLEVWTLAFGGCHHQWVLACKEVLERPVLLLPSRPDDGNNPVIAMGWLQVLLLHLPDKLWQCSKTINNVNTEHLGYVLIPHS